MEHLLTWKQLVFVLLIVLPIYYAIVVYLFYRSELYSLTKTITKIGISNIEANNQQPDRVAEDISLQNVAYDLIEDFKAVFNAAADQQLNRMQIIDALRSKANGYTQVVGTNLQEAINNLIEQELIQRRGWRLSREELNKIWDQ